ncbi:M20/M25/M40 family metallo-hydrolase [Babesia caballi]|uniref:M20/M25/M40 family metallo-hydrolase n=1 Tax=Babesia caballi TaxID=5871 RepID=A0AAV4LWV4_BABCB|nr:M20/M25/M40 family metallo-hydrolase [Babesia caballi]
MRSLPAPLPLLPGILVPPARWGRPRGKLRDEVLVILVGDRGAPGYRSLPGGQPLFHRRRPRVPRLPRGVHGRRRAGRLGNDVHHQLVKLVLVAGVVSMPAVVADGFHYSFVAIALVVEIPLVKLDGVRRRVDEVRVVELILVLLGDLEGRRYVHVHVRGKRGFLVKRAEGVLPVLRFPVKLLPRRQFVEIADSLRLLDFKLQVDVVHGLFQHFVVAVVVEGVVVAHALQSVNDLEVVHVFHLRPQRCRRVLRVRCFRVEPVVDGAEHRLVALQERDAVGGGDLVEVVREVVSVRKRAPGSTYRLHQPKRVEQLHLVHEKKRPVWRLALLLRRVLPLLRDCLVYGNVVRERVYLLMLGEPRLGMGHRVESQHPLVFPAFTLHVRQNPQPRVLLARRGYKNTLYFAPGLLPRCTGFQRSGDGRNLTPLL